MHSTNIHRSQACSDDVVFDKRNLTKEVDQGEHVVMDKWRDRVAVISPI